MPKEVLKKYMKSEGSEIRCDIRKEAITKVLKVTKQGGIWRNTNWMKFVLKKLKKKKKKKDTIEIKESFKEAKGWMKHANMYNYV